MIEFKPMQIDITYYDDMYRISNSATNMFEDSPQTYREFMDKTLTTEDVKSYRKGSMEHMYILQKDDFWKNYEILDFETPSSVQQRQFAEVYLNTEEITDEKRAFKAFSEVYSIKGKSEDKIASESLEMALKLKPYIEYLKLSSEKKVISFAELQSLKQTELNIKTHKLANQLIYDFDKSEDAYAMSEFHINWKHVQTGLPCKSLIDRFIIDISNKVLYLIDLKTTKSISNFNESFKTYSYAKQLSWYWMAIEYYINNYTNMSFNDFDRKTYIIAIKNHDNKQIKVIQIDKQTLTNEDNRIENIMKEISWHTVNKFWNYTREYYEGDGSEQMKIAA